MAIGVSIPEEDWTTSGVAPWVFERESGIVVVVAPADAGLEGAVLVLVV